LRLGDPKLRDLADLWFYRLIMTLFWWRHQIRHLKYIIKMTSQIFSIFKPSPLAKSWLRLCSDLKK